MVINTRFIGLLDGARFVKSIANDLPTQMDVDYVTRMNNEFFMDFTDELIYGNISETNYRNLFNDYVKVMYKIIEASDALGHHHEY